MKAKIPKKTKRSYRKRKPLYEPDKYKKRSNKKMFDVICKCPTCGDTFIVKMHYQPLVMPRQYCEKHEMNRYEEDFVPCHLGL